MKFVKCDCQSCGGPLKEIDSTHFKCKHCGMSYIVDDEHQDITFNSTTNYNFNCDSDGALRRLVTAPDIYPEVSHYEIDRRTNHGCLMAFLMCIIAATILWAISLIR